MTFYKLTVRDVALEGKTVLLRADYNVPLDETDAVHDDFRIQASLPTLEYLLSKNCRIIIVSHLGRPKGRPDPAFSLRPVAQRLADLMQRDIKFVDDCVGDKVYQTVKMTGLKSIILLENVRFHPEEKANDEDFARSLAKSTQADYFIQDGFGAVHRAHATTDAVTHYLPAVAGPLLELEYSTLTSAIENPAKPLVAIMGGAKIGDKIAIIKRFIDRADKILIGGAMANTFLASRGYQLGKSLVEEGQEAILDEIYTAAEAKVGAGAVDQFILLPIDVAVGKTTDVDEGRRVVSLKEIGEDDKVLDIGDETISRFQEVIEGAGTVIWNGPVGFSEVAAFSVGSATVAEAIVASSATSIVGGGDTADFVRSWDPMDGASFSHVSTGGGASLELMSGEALPGVESLLDAKR